MKITNAHGLPQPLVDAVSTREPYEDGRTLSVTELINPPLIRALTREHWEEIEEDVTERIWALFGTSVHAVLEGNALASAEEELSTEFEGWRLVGHPDHLAIYSDLQDGRTVSKLSDWKVTSVWTLVYSLDAGGKPQGRKDWHAQLNLYCWLLARSGIPQPEGLEDVVICRDWSKRDFERAKGAGKYYPELPVVAIPVEYWGHHNVEVYLSDRLKAFEGAPALCTPEERWERKAGNPVRCSGYCAVARWCEYGRQFIKQET